MTGMQGPGVEDDDVLQSMTNAPLQVDGQLIAASNATLRCTIEGKLLCIYKPQRGERPLWDFPAGTLTGREVAAREIDRMLGLNLIPPTVWREEGPAGPGMCQLWVDEDDDARLVDVVAPESVPSDWIPILRARDGEGNPVTLVHADDARLQAMSVLDALINNGDRKGGHVITDTSGRVWGVDHGVSLSVEPKLRTVIWGWAGTPIPDHLVEAIRRFIVDLDSGTGNLQSWLTDLERQALRERAIALVSSQVFPQPSSEWPAVPWPVF